MTTHTQSNGLFFKLVIIAFALYWIWIFFGNVLWFDERVGWQLAWKRDLWVTPQERFVSMWFDYGNRDGWLPLSVSVVIYALKFIATASLAWLIKDRISSHFSSS